MKYLRLRPIFIGKVYRFRRKYFVAYIKTENGRYILHVEMAGTSRRDARHLLKSRYGPIIWQDLLMAHYLLPPLPRDLFRRK